MHEMARERRVGLRGRRPSRSVPIHRERKVEYLQSARPGRSSFASLLLRSIFD